MNDNPTPSPSPNSGRGTDDAKVARHLVANLMGNDDWYRGIPDEVVEIALNLHDKGFLWDDIEEMLQTIVSAVRGEFE